ncbi:MAG: undecaprenyl diphosphate synthase family protein [Acidimicrobiales bacterium]
MPSHVAWVAGGSDRWRRQHSAPAAVVAAAEAEALRELVEGALAVGVRWLTVHVPPEGDARGGAEGDAAHGGVTDPFVAQLTGRGVEVRTLGTDGVVGLGEGRPAARPVGERTPLVLTLADGYSGRGEVVHAVRRLAADGVASPMVDEGSIAERMFAPDMPDPDVVARCGGERRISDLLLWEVAYSELVFFDDPWPEVGRQHLYDAVVEYQRRHRRYGGLAAAGERR